MSIKLSNGARAQIELDIPIDHESKKIMQSIILASRRQERKAKLKRVLASILFSILGFIGYYAIYFLAFSIIALLLLVALRIPVLGIFVEYIFTIADNTPDMFALYASTIITYICFTSTAQKALKRSLTQKITLCLTGIYLTVANIIFLILNINLGNAILTNILLGVSGLIIFFKGKNIKV